MLFSKLLLDNTEPGTFFEWCKVNRGAFVVARYVRFVLGFGTVHVEVGQWNVT